MIAETGCRGVMIGRAALAQPWLFRRAWALIADGRTEPDPSDPDKVAVIHRFFDLMLAQRDERYAMFQIRRRISWFGKHLAGGHCRPLKEAIRTALVPGDVHRAMDEFLAGGLRAVSPIEAEPVA